MTEENEEKGEFRLREGAKNTLRRGYHF